MVIMFGLVTSWRSRTGPRAGRGRTHAYAAFRANAGFQADSANRYR